MDPDLFRVSLRAILPTVVAKVPNEFLFLGINREGRLLVARAAVTCVLT
jgi:hypothetical protein